MNRSASRVFIIDDDASVCKALARLLSASGYATEAFYSANDYLEREPYNGIGCLVLDIRMPGLSGTDLQTHLKRQRNDIPVIFLTGHGDLPVGIEAMKRGAIDFLTKPVDEVSLLDAIDRALSKSQASQREQSSVADVQARIDALTQREKEVLLAILGGARNKQIASALGISEKTVKAHRGKIMQKLNASSPAELGWLCSLANLLIRN
jgi:FixJ family two-component response regulator